MIADSTDAPVLEMEAVTFAYGASAVLSDVSLRLQEGEFVSLLGPSGSGKSTVLRLFAGLESASAGRVVHRGRAVTGPGVERGVVFQDYSLFPWMSLLDNVTFAIGKGHPHLTRQERRDLAEEYLESVGLTESLHKYPQELSGGMCQRGAIARALAMGAPVLLMDEPFGALDPFNRVRLQDLLIEVWRARQPARTILFVTHDVDEAILLADRVVVLGACPGRVIADRKIPFPRPRSRSQLLLSVPFRALRKEVNELLHGDVLERLAATGLLSPAEGI